MMGDAMDDAMAGSDEEAELDGVVGQLLDEIGVGAAAALAAAPAPRAKAKAAAAAAPSEEDAEADALVGRLTALKD